MLLPVKLGRLYATKVCRHISVGHVKKFLPVTDTAMLAESHVDAAYTSRRALCQNS